MKSAVETRQVWHRNLMVELERLKSTASLYPLVAMDTEFPGTVIDADVPHYSQSPELQYQLMKANVDATNIIQLGLTLSDSQGNNCYMWEFNFCDFDVDRDLQNEDAIAMLEEQGIDFEANKERGIRSSDFSFVMQYLELVGGGASSPGSRLTWVTFHGSYDFGYLIKILNQQPLPENLDGFMSMVRFYFGPRVYDIKHMIKFCDGLYGGLEQVARSLEVDRVAGNSHQAGSDSLLTLQTFVKVNDVYFKDKDNNINIGNFEGAVFGLGVHPISKAKAMMGTFKLTIDSSCYRECGQIHASLVRESDGDWIFGFSGNPGIGMVTVGELWALNQGLKIAWEMGVQDLEVECSSYVIRLVSMPKFQLHPILQHFVADCKEAIDRDWNCVLLHANRPPNNYSLSDGESDGDHLQFHHYEDICYPLFIN